MKAAQVEKYGEINDIRIKDIPVPDIGEKEVLIRIAYAGVNFPDVLITKGLYQFRPEPPFSPGGEVAGIVEKIGNKVTSFKVGDRLMAAASWGGFSQVQKYNEDNCFSLPDNVDLKDAAALLETYATAYHALVDRAQLQKGQRLAVLGAAGGTGTAAVQLGKVLGAQVVAVAGSAEKTDFCKIQGADHVIDYNSCVLKDELKKIGGIDVVFDPVGGAASESAFRALKPMGKHLVVGFASGDIPSLPWNLPLLKSADIVGVFWGGFWRNFPKQNKRNVDILVELLGESKIKPAITSEYSLKNVREALLELDQRKVKGKVVIKMD